MSSSTPTTADPIAGSGEPSLPSPPGKPKRLDFIDLLRGWAVIIMIETHVLNATLLPSLRLELPFKILDFINGLVAPAFLFASGLAYAVVTRRKLHDYLSFGPPLLKQLWRLLFILIIGYGLHIPKFYFHHLMYEAGEEAWHAFFQVDVLQCIAVSLLTLQILLLVLRSERRLYMVTAGLTAAIIIASPLVWGVDFWTIFPIPLAEYFNGRHFSGFPLFPWSAFLFAGALMGYSYLQAGGGSAPANLPAKAPFMKRVAWVGLGLVLLSFPLHPLGAMIYPVYDYWKSSPGFYMLRLGLVLLLCAGAFAFEYRRGVSPRSIVTLIGRESLLVYTVHLMLIYGNYGSGHFADHVHLSYGYGEVLAVSLVLFVLMYLLAWTWSKIRKAKPAIRIGVELCILAGFLIVFFVGFGQ
ncbi:DUF1624 domain-containing protein [bacterium]|nr:MAG: DUF1624 domain-containing protein [bacterium]